MQWDSSFLFELTETLSFSLLVRCQLIFSAWLALSSTLWLIKLLCCVVRRVFVSNAKLPMGCALKDAILFSMQIEIIKCAFNVYNTQIGQALISAMSNLMLCRKIMNELYIAWWLKIWHGLFLIRELYRYIWKSLSDNLTICLILVLTREQERFRTKRIIGERRRPLSMTLKRAFVLQFLFRLLSENVSRNCFCCFVVLSLIMRKSEKI